MNHFTDDHGRGALVVALVVVAGSYVGVALVSPTVARTVGIGYIAVAATLLVLLRLCHRGG